MRCQIAYLITFTTYGTWLHGDKRGSVNKEHNRYNSDFVGPNTGLCRKEQIALKNPPLILDKKRREIVMRAIMRVCEFRGWFVHAVHVRRSHVHIVVSGEVRPEKMMTSFKAFATRAIRRCIDRQSPVKKYWTRHGSTKYIWTKESLASAINYVKYEQGKIMTFCSMYSQSPER